MSEVNNPAGRLHYFMRQVQSGKFPKGTSVESALFTIWSIPVGNKSLLLAQLSSLMTLPLQIREAVGRHDDMSSELLLKWLPAIEEAFSSLNLGKDVEQFQARFNENVAYGVELCSDYLSRRSPEKIVNREEVDALFDLVSELKQFTISSDITPAVKRYILTQLDQIERALREYYISGNVPLEQAINAAIGSALTNHDLAQESSRVAAGKKFWELVGRTQTILSASWTAMQIGDKAGAVLALMKGI